MNSGEIDYEKFVEAVTDNDVAVDGSNDARRATDAEFEATSKEFEKLSQRLEEKRERNQILRCNLSEKRNVREILDKKSAALAETIKEKDAECWALKSQMWKDSNDIRKQELALITDLKSLDDEFNPENLLQKITETSNVIEYVKGVLEHTEGKLRESVDSLRKMYSERADPLPDIGDLTEILKKESAAMCGDEVMVQKRLALLEQRIAFLELEVAEE